MLKILHEILLRIMSKYLDKDIVNEVLGDLTEDYNKNIEEHGLRKARINFILAALGYFRYWHLLKLISSERNIYTMDIWKNYFVSSIRNLARNKRYTALSIIGLIVGFASSLTILQYAYYENSYDGFYGDTDVYRLTHTFTNNSGVTESAATFMALRDALKSEVPEIQDLTHFSATGGSVKIDEDIFSEESIISASSDFLEIFKLEILAGNPKSLDDPDVVFLSESTIQKYFDSNRNTGQTLELQGIFGQNWKARVGGIFKNIPANSHLDVDIIFSETKLINTFRDGNLFGNISPEDLPWRLLGFPTYVTINSTASHEQVVSKANELIARGREVINKELDQKHEIWLQHVSTIHTTPGIQGEMTPTNDSSIILLFTIIAVLILLIAWINYINLSTARSVTRSKEVGIRKVMGSHKFQLRNQFLLEVFILNFIAIAISLIIIQILSPQLEEIIGVNFFAHGWLNLRSIILILLILIGGSLLSGLYPAFILSNYNCLEVLKGKLKYSSKGIILRRILVVSQFVFSIFLISALLIVQSQMNFMINHNLGVNINETFLLNAAMGQSNEPDYTARMRSFLNGLDNISGVSKTSVSSLVPGIQNNWRNSTERRTGQGAGLFIHRSIIDQDYLDLYGIDLIAGRNISEAFGNEETSLVINETTRRSLGFVSAEEILNERIYFAGIEYKVVGVVNDFYQRGAQFAYEPMSFSLDTALTGNFISIKLETSDLNNVLTEIEEKYKSSFPGSPYVGRFLDDVFQDQYVAEFRFRNLFTIFSVIALSIACLGLIGLSSYVINQKMKEIGIRKVLGARAADLFLMLNKEYFMICVLSFFIAGPAVFLLNPMWLENFANRINVHPGFYIAPLLAVLVIVLITTAGYTMKAILINPSKTLKEE